MAETNRRIEVPTMKNTAQIIARALPSCIVSGALAAVLLVPSTAGAWNTGYSSHYYSSGSSGWGSSRYQDDANEQADEAYRRGQRQKNREEIEKKRAADEKEYLASRAAAREASAAAFRAPRDAFYRKPGSTLATMPDAHVKVAVGDQTYFYFRGIFYFQLPGKFIAVHAPVGAVVDTLPEGITGAIYKGDAETYTYYFGTFFMEENGKYKVVTPPAGTTVGYVPDGYTESEVDGTVQYQFGDIRFSPGFYGQEVIYQVAG
jgi:hypothetical protein